MNTATTHVRSGEELRARRRRRLANEIELVALRLFAEHGVEAVTVDDIAAATDISRRTFFRYFSSKDEILAGNPERHQEIVHAALESASVEATSAALVRDVLLALTRDFDEHREAMLLRKRIAAKSPGALSQSQGRTTALVDSIVDAVATRMDVDPETDLRPHVYVHAGLGALQAALRIWFSDNAGASLSALASEALDLIGLR